LHKLFILLIGLAFGIPVPALGNDSTTTVTPKPTGMAAFRDTLDGKLDMSRHLAEAHGFMPVPIIITEPALGGFGGGLALVFLSRPEPVEAEGHTRTLRPDMTALAGAYTANKSWLAGGGRIATLPKYRLRYRAGAGLADMNLDFYEQLPSGEDQAFRFNIRSTPLFASLARELWDSRFTIGTQYLLAGMDVRLDQDGDLPAFVEDGQIEQTLSQLGLMAEYDSRDNILTPDDGVIVQALANWSDDWLGSDVTYQKLDGDLCWFVPLGSRWSDGRNWISGLRIRGQQMFDDPPFYLLPYVGMRGVPAARYQGRTSLTAETEQRFDFTRRWSAVAFGGVGKAFDDWDAISDAELIYSAGAGFRYLVAREFKLRAGIDVARGPEEWAWYIIFGSAWFQ